jgi:RNA polymerase sigma factor (sigma-70 family)
MTFVEIQSEFHEQRIGVLIYREVHALAQKIVQRYNPQIYLNASSWQDGLEDYVQEFVSTVLIEEGQLEYVMEVAGSLDDFRNLLARQMRRLLARRRRRTVVDNLLDRCRQIASEPPFESATTGRSWSYFISGSTAGPGRPDQVALRSMAIELSLFPLVRSDSSERAPIVYTAETLRSVLHSVAGSLGVRVTLSDLDEIFREGLTFLLPGDLSQDEGAILETAASEISPEDEVVVNDGVRVVLESLTTEERLVLRMKLSDRSDSEIAEASGVSRPTVDKRKKQALKKLEFALEDLPPNLQVAVMERVSIELARESP